MPYARLRRAHCTEPMGQEIASHQFQPQDFQRFREALQIETQALAAEIPRISPGGFVAGMELETCLLDEHYNPHPINQSFLKHLNHPQVVPELAQFNVEMNVSPQKLWVQVCGFYINNWQRLGICVNLRPRTWDPDW